MIIECDNCSHTFNVNQIKDIKQEAIKNDIVRHFIECPDCQHKFTTHYENDAIREITAEIRRLQKKVPLKIKQKNKLHKLRRKVRVMADTLKTVVEKDES
ncbi:hypothetical protein [Gracilibacillus lacisalsi]|uniref:hypothetical protein n=1 Tax=Gracilibacillus lacisalsi TaxID=393087 RepID=UPI000381C812|nr:hypothetical protein [Gracilibacillus lacisalsi]